MRGILVANMQVRQEIQKAKLELTFEHQRSPMVEEIIARVGISSERYHDVMKASTSVYSLNARHAITQEEFVDCIRDVDGADGEATPRQTTLRRLAIDDVVRASWSTAPWRINSSKH
ncbi:hypothetical protein HPP92_005516 [Vanilla planifolia]|uniref:RNA polymerase sigma-70 region 3 domain-containing protein n=1 Tax=Vanilla planifolia TaxID=51239 RepID=A0A835RKE4_VANPL|nr:hypothetical protein HPP92_005516 [Vanilla planifolia]